MNDDVNREPTEPGVEEESSYIHTPVTFDAVFIPPAPTFSQTVIPPAPQEPPPEPPQEQVQDTPAEPPASTRTYGEYAQYGYRQEPPPQRQKPVRSKSGIVFGLLLGVALTLIGVLAAFFISGGQIEITRMPGGRLSGRVPPASPAPSAEATPRPSGGGGKKLDIVPVAPPSSQPQPAGERGPLTNSEIAKKGSPSVVCILVESTALGYNASGSGIIMDEEGGFTYIITNCHVVRGYDVVDVVLHNSEEYRATVVGMDQFSDLAVIKIEATGLIHAEFGDSDSLQIGDPVMVIGNPMGLELQGTATQGIISAINRDITIQGRVMTMLQTDASVNHGNSGGPLFNQYGQVVGIISSKIMGNFSTVVEGLGFAIPTAIAKPVIDDLIAKGYVSGRPTIGITNYTVITAPEAQFFDIPQGVRVLGISENCDAYKQGLRVDDVIFKVNGEEIHDGDELNLIKGRFGVGDTLTLTVYRDGGELEISFKLMDEGELR